MCSRRTRSAAYPSGASLPFGNTSPTRPACPYALTISTCTACSQAHARDGHAILIDSSPPRSFSMEPETLIHISGAIKGGLPPPRLHPPIPKDPADSPPPPCLRSMVGRVKSGKRAQFFHLVACATANAGDGPARAHPDRAHCPAPPAPLAPSSIVMAALQAAPRVECAASCSDQRR